LVEQQKRFAGRAIAFQISISYNACHPERSEGSAVVLLCFTVKVGKAMMPNLRRLAGNTPKNNRRSFVAALLRMTNRSECSKKFKCNCPGFAGEFGCLNQKKGRMLEASGLEVGVTIRKLCEVR
jgi:hypothetical protein